MTDVYDDKRRWTEEQLDNLKAKLNSIHLLDPIFCQCSDAIGSLQFDLVDARAELARLRKEHYRGVTEFAEWKAARLRQPRWRHKKRGSTYNEIGRGELQVSEGTLAAEGSRLVVYRGEDGRLWIRPEIEFNDGRFEQVAGAPESLRQPVPEGETKEATHRRYYDAFRAWFMQSNCDFWSECDAPEELATIAVELQDAAITAAKQRARREAIEECARIVEQVSDPDDDTDIGNAATDAFNAKPRTPVNERLEAWGKAIANGIRALADTGEQEGER